MKSFEIISKKFGIFQVLVDDEDYDRTIKFKWHVNKTPHNVFYVCRYIKVNGKQKYQKLHRFLMNVVDPKVLVDHVDGNGLNNQRSTNLRIATGSQNGMNRRKQNNNTSGFKGVGWHKQCEKFTATIAINGRNKHLGLFSTAEEASKVYETKAKELFGEFYRNPKPLF